MPFAIIPFQMIPPCITILHARLPASGTVLHIAICTTRLKCGFRHGATYCHLKGKAEIWLDNATVQDLLAELMMQSPQVDLPPIKALSPIKGLSGDFGSLASTGQCCSPLGSRLELKGTWAAQAAGFYAA